MVQAREPLFALVSNRRLELTFIRRLNPQLFFFSFPARAPAHAEVKSQPEEGADGYCRSTPLRPYAVITSF